MTWIEALIIGMVQGIGEFFPISSSAHIHLINAFFHLPQDRFFDLICHCGTTFACLIFLFSEVKSLFTQKHKELFTYVIALAPLFPIYFLGGALIKKLSSDAFLGVFLIISALFLFSMAFFPKKESSERKFSDMLLIGLAQGAALIPGLSRSASTIATASLRRWDLQRAMKFSFLLAIPTIFGGSVLEIMQKEMTLQYPLSIYFLGFCSSLLLGLITIRLLFKIKNRKTFGYFGIYCSLLGIFLLFWGLR